MISSEVEEIVSNFNDRVKEIIMSQSLFEDEEEEEDAGYMNFNSERVRNSIKQFSEIVPYSCDFSEILDREEGDEPMKRVNTLKPSRNRGLFDKIEIEGVRQPQSERVQKLVDSGLMSNKNIIEMFGEKEGSDMVADEVFYDEYDVESQKKDEESCQEESQEAENSKINITDNVNLESFGFGTYEDKESNKDESLDVEKELSGEEIQQQDTRNQLDFIDEFDQAMTNPVIVSNNVEKRARLINIDTNFKADFEDRPKKLGSKPLTTTQRRNIFNADLLENKISSENASPNLELKVNSFSDIRVETDKKLTPRIGIHKQERDSSETRLYKIDSKINNVATHRTVEQQKKNFHSERSFSLQNPFVIGGPKPEDVRDIKLYITQGFKKPTTRTKNYRRAQRANYSHGQKSMPFTQQKWVYEKRNSFLNDMLSFMTPDNSSNLNFRNELPKQSPPTPPKIEEKQEERKEEEQKKKPGISKAYEFALRKIKKKLDSNEKKKKNIVADDMQNHFIDLNKKAVQKGKYITCQICNSKVKKTQFKIHFHQCKVLFNKIKRKRKRQLDIQSYDFGKRFKKVVDLKAVDESDDLFDAGSPHHPHYLINHEKNLLKNVRFKKISNQNFNVVTGERKSLVKKRL